MVCVHNILIDVVARLPLRSHVGMSEPQSVQPDQVILPYLIHGLGSQEKLSQSLTKTL